MFYFLLNLKYTLEGLETKLHYVYICVVLVCAY